VSDNSEAIKKTTVYKFGTTGGNRGEV